jgi:spore germination protein YaaH
MTTGLLQDNHGRKEAVREMAMLCEKYGLDGLNLDFENIAADDKGRLVDFVGEIAAVLHAKEKTVSMDITMPSASGNWSKCYDRAALAKRVDYMMLMAYDEHGRLSKSSGSVASLPWTEKGLRMTLREVPSHKLLLGMPLYMRLWEEKDGVVTAKTLSMLQAEKLWREKNTARSWLADCGQYYFEYKEKAVLYRVWQEEARSLTLKAALISRYDLAGGAFWRSGLEDASVWQPLAAACENAER